MKDCFVVEVACKFPLGVKCSYCLRFKKDCKCSGVICSKCRNMIEAVPCKGCNKCKACCSCVICSKCGASDSPCKLHAVPSNTERRFCNRCCPCLLLTTTSTFNSDEISSYPDFSTLILITSNFYTTEALVAELSSALSNEDNLIKKRIDTSQVTELYKEVVEYQRKHIKLFSRMLFDYTVAASMGEARHFCYYKSHEVGLLCGSYQERVNVYRSLDGYNAEDLVNKCIQLFTYPDTWKGSVGGTAWAQIAKAGEMYLEAKGDIRKEKIFLDHAVDLAHNNGKYINKENPWFTCQGTSQYTMLLSTKSSYGGLLMHRVYVEEALEKFIQRAGALRILPTSITTLERQVISRDLDYGRPVSYGHKKKAFQMYHKIMVGSENLTLTEAVNKSRRYVSMISNRYTLAYPKILAKNEFPGLFQMQVESLLGLGLEPNIKPALEWEPFCECAKCLPLTSYFITHCGHNQLQSIRPVEVIYNYGGTE